MERVTTDGIALSMLPGVARGTRLDCESRRISQRWPRTQRRV